MIDVAHELRATWRRPARVHPVGPLAAAVVLIVASATLHSTVGGMIGLVTIVGIVASRLHPPSLPWLYPTRERGVVAISPCGDWTWCGVVIATRATVRQALVDPPIEDAPALLRVELRGGDALEFEAPLGEARRLIEAAQLGATSSVTTFTLASRADTHAVVGWCLVGAPVACLVAGFLLENVGVGLLSIPAIAVAVLGFAIPTRVRVGADALEWRWLLWRTRIGYRELRAPKYGEGRIVFHRLNGTRILLRTGTSPKHVTVHHRLVERLQQALRAHAQSSEAPRFDLARLDRHGDSVDDWIARLRALGAPSTPDYRAALVDPSTLVTTVHDTTVSSARRAAALVAIAHALEPDERAELAARAKGLLDADLSAAIEATLASDDGALRPAMVALTRE